MLHVLTNYLFSLVNLPFSTGVSAKNSEGRKKIIFPPLQLQGWALGELGAGGPACLAVTGNALSWMACQ